VKVFLRVFLAGLPTVILWCVFDWIYVKTPSLQTSRALSNGIGCVFLALLPVCIFLSLLGPRKRNAIGGSAAVIWFIGATVVWGFVAWTVAMNFHLAIGGKL